MDSFVSCFFKILQTFIILWAKIPQARMVPSILDFLFIELILEELKSAQKKVSIKNLSNSFFIYPFIGSTK